MHVTEQQHLPNSGMEKKRAKDLRLTSNSPNKRIEGGNLVKLQIIELNKIPKASENMKIYSQL